MMERWKTEYRDQHKGQEIEQIDWVQLRRDTTQKLIGLIHVAAIEHVRIQRGQEYSLNEGNWRGILEDIAIAEHLTIGSIACQCGMCGESNGSHELMRGDVTNYDKKEHVLVPAAYPDPKDGDIVRVLFPYIGDNLLKEPIELATVRSLYLGEKVYFGSAPNGKRYVYQHGKDYDGFDLDVE